MAIRRKKFNYMVNRNWRIAQATADPAALIHYIYSGLLILCHPYDAQN
jgi:hypothetical protein